MFFQSLLEKRPCMSSVRVCFYEHYTVLFVSPIVILWPSRLYVDVYHVHGGYAAMQDVPGGVQSPTEIRRVIIGGPPDSSLRVLSSSSSGSVSSEGNAVSQRASSRIASACNAPSGKEERPAGRSHSFKIAAYPGKPLSQCVCVPCIALEHGIQE